MFRNQVLFLFLPSSSITLITSVLILSTILHTSANPVNVSVEDDSHSKAIHRFILHLNAAENTPNVSTTSTSTEGSASSSSSSPTSRIYLERGKLLEDSDPHLSEGNNRRPTVRGGSGSNVGTHPSSIPIQTSVQVYIIFVIGIVPAALAGAFWWLQNLCHCFRRKKKCAQNDDRKSITTTAQSGNDQHSNSTLSSQTLTSHVPSSSAPSDKFSSTLLKNAKSLDNLVMARRLVRRAERRISENTDDEPKKSSRGSNHYKRSLAASGRLVEKEMPRNSLEMMQILGEGNFGQVWKARYHTLEPHPKHKASAFVAVKTLKVNFTAEQQEDLLKELDIMLQLGMHPNVVRLLGCCTENEPYYLVLEYLAHGKLLSFLRKHRKDQAYSMVTPSHLYHGSDGCTESTSGDMRTLVNPNLNWYSNNSYRRHSSSNCDELTPIDLVAFGAQIAAGMEFISAHGIIHRDLAARNILVSADRQCKIADFGLSRSIRDSADGDWYEMKHGGQMPIRWMSPEALSMGVFSTKSDVWAYGILLWEIATLGSTPYVGMGAQEVIAYIRQGNICPRPEHCEDGELYELMMSCWAYKADERLTFGEIRAQLQRMLVEMGENELNNNKSYIDLEHFNDSLYYFKTNVGDEKL